VYNEFRHVMLNACTDGPQHLLLAINCVCWNFCFFTAMTSMKKDVTIKKTLEIIIPFIGYRKSMNSPRHLKNDKFVRLLLSLGKTGGGVKFAPVVFGALRPSENYTNVTLKVL